MVVSIFVNPTQFAPTEDLAKYPRTPEKDLELCRLHGGELVFMPGVVEMYPIEAGTDADRQSVQAQQPRPASRSASVPFAPPMTDVTVKELSGQTGQILTEVSVKDLSARLCGKSRPTHFAGVCTVVAKLFNIVLPDAAFFGTKDYQQATIIRRMVADLNFPVQIEVCPTVREADGLAMSSRNAYLSAEHRRAAPAIHEALSLGGELIGRSHPPAEQVIAAMREHLAVRAPEGVIDYLEIVDPDTLGGVERTDAPVVIAAAVRFGATRLIDNIAVDARPTAT